MVALLNVRQLRRSRRLRRRIAWYTAPTRGPREVGMSVAPGQQSAHERDRHIGTPLTQR
jgi:hypothetical protein